MHFINIVFATLITFLSQVLANSIRFYNVDSVDRFICWFPNAGISGIPITYVPANSQDVIVFPEYGWSGQFHSTYTYGDCDTPSIVAEVTWQGGFGMTWYDLSAVDSLDNANFHWLQPANSVGISDLSAASGCWVFPCLTAFINPNDPQTKSTYEVDLAVSIFVGAASRSERGQWLWFVTWIGVAIVAAGSAF